jgi:hypothetical protein
MKQLQELRTWEKLLSVGHERFEQAEVRAGQHLN